MAQVAEKIRHDSAEQVVRDLALKHEIGVARTQLDDWADDVTRLAGDDVILDEVEELIVGLRKSGQVDGIELTRLHSRYLDERSPR